MFSRLPDLFRGTQAVVFGRYEGSKSPLKPRLQLTGMANGKAQSIAGEGDWSGVRDNEMLPRLWAMRKVGYLVDDARLSGREVSGEVRDEIVKLSKKYGIVTPFTAALITEDTPASPVFSDRLAVNGASRRRGSVFRSGPASDSAADESLATGGFGGAGGGGFAGGMMAPSASAPVSGARAVAAAKAGRAMRDTERVKDEANSRYIDGKAFFLRDGVWTDSAFDAAKSAPPQKIKFGSTEYFALLKTAHVAKWLSIGERVILVVGTRVVQIEP
jgi:hypothetical protein